MTPQGGRAKTNVGDTTRAPLQVIHMWTAHWLHPCQCQMSDKRNTDGQTISNSYSRQAVNSLCETIKSQLVTQLYTRTFSPICDDIR